MTPAETWAQTRLVAEVWWCGDDHCDCTEAQIVEVTPNRDLGYPWVRRRLIWQAGFMTGTWSVEPADREREQYGPLRAECARLGVPVPADVP